MNEPARVIFECANFHGGNVELLRKAIEKFANIEYKNSHIKFQPFKYDLTALEDFSYYDVYKKLHIDSSNWKSLIGRASELYSGVWIDINDPFSLRVLEENFDKIHGVKLQSSVIGNFEIIEGLKSFDLSAKIVMINISGYSLDEIQEFIDSFEGMGMDDLVIQAGFQSYPTKIEDSSLNKITSLALRFPNVPICFADHVDANDEFSTIIPSLAYSKGATYIEKHICVDRASAEYDSFSALEYEEALLATQILSKSFAAFGEQFISQSEHEYLKSTIQKPVVAKDLKPGQLVSDSDLLYRRTGQDGLNTKEIKKLQAQGHILKEGLVAGRTLKFSDFKKAKIGVIVACRLKSSRLPNKALLPIQGVSLIQRCINNCRMFPADMVILATSDNPQDAQLEAEATAQDIPFFQGDPDDVIHRYLDVCDKYDLDIVFRMTGDNPVPSAEIADYMLQAHLACGSDYSYPDNITVGITTEIYNVRSLRYIAEKVGCANYSEYMNWYVINNPEHFKINKITLPPSLYRSGYRLTVDYQSDLELMQLLFEQLEANKREPTTPNIFKLLDENKDIVSINSQEKVLYQDDDGLIKALQEKTKFGAFQ